MAGFELGELITVSKPYAYVLNDDQRGLRCDYCFKKLEHAKHCRRCYFVCYCNRSCQETAWEAHQTECKLLKRARTKPSDDVRYLALIILKRKKYGPDEPFEEILGRRVTFGTLMSHAEDIKKDIKSDKTMQALVVSVREFIGDANMPPLDEYIETYGKRVINSFGISDGMTLIGSGLYLGASVFDHSCNPNAEYISEGVDLWIRANRRIRGRDISKVFISYINILEVTKVRQDNLMSSYYFLCQCNHCTSTEREELMTNIEVNGHMDLDKMPRIMGFKAAVSIAEKKALAVEDPILYEQCVNGIKEFITLELLPDTHICMVKAFKILFQFSVTKGKFSDPSEALFYGKKLLESYRRYLEPYSYAKGYASLRVSKLYFVIGNYAACVAHAEEAKKILKVIPGEEHSMYQEIFHTEDF